MTSNANAKENNDEGKQANHNGAKIFENWHRFFNLTAERRVRQGKAPKPDMPIALMNIYF